MSASRQTQHLRMSVKTQDSKSDADERFFAALKDMIELLKSWTLGAALLGTGFAIISSDFSIPTRVVGALVCITMGTMVFVSAVLIFSRHRMAVQGQPIREQVERAIKFVLLMICGLAVCYLTMELLRQPLLSDKNTCPEAQISNK